MADTISWLHLTDLHFGLDKQSWMWPTVRHLLFEDLVKLAAKSEGGWDLVFFTGDLTQNGTSAEFERLDSELDELWRVLSSAGKIPKLCVVPGNHDLVRPPGNSAAAKAITKLWQADEEIRKEFWNDAESDYRELVEKAFAPFTEWTRKTHLPLIERQTGILPGDFSGTIEVGLSRIGIVGLNSAFLQIAPGNYKEKLDLHVAQLHGVCGGDAFRWAQSHSASFLLTHHPPSWLSPSAIEHFRQEIYPPGRFAAHFFGHQHQPHSSDTAEAGASQRRLRQGPSLFGLKHIGDGSMQRCHGYTAGRFVLDGPAGTEMLWPRTAVRAHSGGFNISADHGYTLDADGCMLSRFEVRVLVSSAEPEPKTPVEFESESRQISLFDGVPSEVLTCSQLARCPTYKRAVESQHRCVRLDERQDAIQQLRELRKVWIAAEWGVAEHEFVASVIEELSPAPSAAIFHLRCDDASTAHEFESLFPQQFGMSLQAFCGHAASLGDGGLVLGGLHPALSSSEALRPFQNILDAILDYCPHLYIIVMCRVAPDDGTFVRVGSLDLPETRSYVLNHPQASSELSNPNVVERVFEKSDGLPMHIDSILKSLSVSSLYDALGADYEESTAVLDVPRGLVQAVASVSGSPERREQRSLRLLKVLCMLSYGESIDVLRHYFSTEPFFPENAIQLQQLGLLEVVPLQAASRGGVVGQGPVDGHAPKILRVPRQVRDYVQTLMSPEERNEIVRSGMDRFFGRDWREGKIRLRRLPPEYKQYLNNGTGNELVLLLAYFASAKLQGDEIAIRRGVNIGIQFAGALKVADRFRDLSLVAERVLQCIDRDQFPGEWASLSLLLAKGLRMTHDRARSIQFAREALDVENSKLTQEQRASAWLNIALAEESSGGDAEEAIAAAEQVLGLTQPNDATHQHALAIAANLKFEGAERRQRLVEIEKAARRNGHMVVAENILLALATESGDRATKIRLIDTVLAADDRGYNHVRAIVAKAKLVRENGEELSSKDATSLVAAYSYLHGQRFTALFDSCHDALWALFEARGDTAKLLRLFRHTSFLWRVRGDEVQESAYLERLRALQAAAGSPKQVGLEFGYFMRRLRAILGLGG